MQVYTRTGDDGNTHLASGKRVPKHALRVEIYGECDELNSVLGLAISLCEGPLEGLGADLTNEQHLLFELGSELAGFEARPNTSVILQADIDRLEKRMDSCRASRNEGFCAARWKPGQRCPSREPHSLPSSGTPDDARPANKQQPGSRWSNRNPRRSVALHQSPVRLSLCLRQICKLPQRPTGRTLGVARAKNQKRRRLTARDYCDNR